MHMQIPVELIWGAAVAMSFLGLLYVYLLIRFARLKKIAQRQSQEASPTAAPSVSVIIAAHDQALALEENLPLFLQQEYPGEFEVIVVDIHSTDETADVLERLENEYPALSHTNVPASARDISLERLAVMLGMRASAGEWLVLSNAQYKPLSNNWLSSLMSQAKEDVDVILGYTSEERIQSMGASFGQFMQLWEQMLWMPHALRHLPYRADEGLTAIRRETFIGKSIFAESANLVGSVHTLLVNQNAEKGRVAVSVQPESQLCLTPTRLHSYWQRNVFFMQERRTLHEVCLYRLHYALQVLVPRLFGWSCVAMAALLGFAIEPLLALAPLSVFLIMALVRHRIYRLTAKRLDVRTSSIAYWLYEALIPYIDTAAWLTWRFSKKRTFRKKFV